MKPIRSGVRWILTTCVALLSTCAIADVPSAATECVFDLVETTPSSDFTSLEGGAVVRHEPTGLEWRRCAEGMLWTGNDCTGSATAWTWQGALQHADAVSGWRLPNINELRSIVERCRTGPAVNQEVFPNTPLAVWSASPYAGHSEFAWIVIFNSGNGIMVRKSFGHWVRLVRDQRLIAGRYEAIGVDGGVIHDIRTGLEWKRCSEGQEWNKASNSCDGAPFSLFWREAVETYGTWDNATIWPDALLSEMILPFPTGEWRLPTIEQLGSLLYCSTGNPEEFDPDQPCQGLDFTRPTINLEAFPNSPTYDVWSGSSSWGGIDGIDEFSVWRAHFWSGYVTANFAGGSANPIRLVHDPNL